MVRELVGAAIEFGIGEALVPRYDNDGIRGPFHLFFEQLVNTRIRVFCGCLVPLNEQLTALWFGEQRQFRYAALGCRNQRLE